MFSTHINYLAVLAAAVVAWIAGAVWYGVLSKQWLTATGKTREEISASSMKPAWAPFIISFLLEIVMAYILARLMAGLQMGTIAGGLTVGAAAWAGFVMPTVAVNNLYPGRKPMLTAIDSAHWLLVLLIEGLVIGAMG